MDEALRQYKNYNELIKYLTYERNQKVMEALSNRAIAVKDKVTTKSKTAINKFKNSIKDIDLKAKNVVFKAALFVVNKINNFLAFRNKIINFIKDSGDKVKTVQKTAIDNFKENYGQMIALFYDMNTGEILSINSSLIDDRLNDARTQEFARDKCRIGTYSKDMIDRFKQKFGSVYKDIDLKTRNIVTKGQEKALGVEIKVIDKYQKFKSNVIQFSNTTKNKVSTVSKSVKDKISKGVQTVKDKVVSTFTSSEEHREGLKQEISDRQKKIAELKEYRKKLLDSKNRSQTEEQEENVGRSRGNIYSWMAILFSCISFLMVILINIIKK